MDISIIIPTTQNRADIFNKTLYCAVAALEGIDAEIIVVIDSENYEPFIDNKYNNIIVVKNPGKGVAAARNYGVSLSSSDLILFLDNDIIITSESVRHTIYLHKQMPDICLNPDWIYPPELLHKLENTNFGRFLIRNNMVTFKGWYNDASWKDNELFISKSVASFHLSIAKHHFLKSGGYNALFPYAGFEDYDFPARLKALGLKFYIDTRIKVLHNEEDKVDLSVRLKGLRQRAVTRRIAVKLGYNELSLKYSLFQHVLFNALYLFQKPLLVVVNRLHDKRFFKIYSTLLRGLEAAIIYRGYEINES